uniref:Uncharacterized protein n=1 Tax=Ovis aries TaxID=9940 RepID=A0AC11BR68_SHEEP
MKGALLVLALLVTRELTFETHEACPVFYGAVGTIFIGSKTLLNSTFDLVDATDEEKEAIRKLQDCFNENGFRAKLFIIKLVVIDSFHPLPCPATHMNRILMFGRKGSIQLTHM